MILAPCETGKSQFMGTHAVLLLGVMLKLRIAHHPDATPTEPQPCEKEPSLWLLPLARNVQQQLKLRYLCSSGPRDHNLQKQTTPPRIQINTRLRCEILQPVITSSNCRKLWKQDKPSTLKPQVLSIRTTCLENPRTS